jgi:hypothetical protein
MRKRPVFSSYSFFHYFSICYQRKLNKTLLTLLRSYDLLSTQLNVYPQEKIHLHTDRNYYVPGEKIWFKAYVIDAHTHLYPTQSQYVYVELISPVETLVERVMIRPNDDIFYGHLPLSKNIPEGDYTLRAYTRYMENLGDDYFFKKNIRIGNLAKERENRGNGRRSRNRESRDDFDVSFFPEGGNLLEGVYCKIAFKAINKNGYPETVTGKLVDEAGIEITSVNTYYAGMGVFVYSPVLEKKYYLKCENRNGLEKQFELPQPHSQAYALTASLNNKKLIIGVQHSIHALEPPVYLLAHCRGKVLYFSEYDQQKKFLTFAEYQFPAGVIQFILFDGQMNPLSERVVFCKNYDEAKLAFHTDKALYEKREKVTTTLKLLSPESTALSPSPLGRAGVGLLSVAITDDKDIAVDSSTTIFSSLLLSSELRGYIENPAYYLQDDIALDYLMMTHGWRRYNIPEVVKGYLEYPKIPYQTAQQITGQVTSLLNSKPIPDSEITLMARGGGFGIVSTDKQGLFTFQDLEFPDSTSYMIQALDKKGSSKVKLSLDKEKFPQLSYAPQSPFSEIPVIEPDKKEETVIEAEVKVKPANADAFIEKAEQRAKYDENMRIYQLDEVEITAQRIVKEPRLQVFPLNEHSDVTIGRDVIEKKRRYQVADYLRSVPGVRLLRKESWRGYHVRIRGAIDDPLVIIDGIPVFCTDCDPLETVPIDAIESIDVFMSAESISLFGSRGANGAISITTKRGENKMVSPKEEFNYVVYTPLGYQKPAEFYSPKYETLETKRSVIPDYRTTIFWKPDIVISDENEASFQFYTSDFPTTYSVVIEGITTDGRIVRQVEKIQVE